MSDAHEKSQHDDMLRLVADIVSAYVGKNPLPAAQIPEVISSVFSSLTTLDGGSAEVRNEAPKPVVPIKKSVTPDYIICLEDGKKLKMLKRHLRTTYNMTPEDYRARWGLPSDYPMVAPNYANQRSEFAKRIGLGKKTDETPKSSRKRTPAR